MLNKIKAATAAAALTGALMVAPAVAADAAPVQDAKIAAAASYCPWWVANGYWRLIWWTFNPGQCR